MKVFTFFYNRFETATTSIALAKNNIPHTVLVHDEDSLKQFNKHGTIQGTPLVTYQPKGLANQRNFALAQMQIDEWAVFMCDDFKKVLSFPKEFILSETLKAPVDMTNQNAFRLKQVNEISLAQMFEFFPSLIKLADLNNIRLVGFGLHDNPQNLRRKFTTRCLADGRFWLVKKSNYTFDPAAQLIDDVAWTAENLVRHGNVLVLNWCVPYFERYSAGGFGTQAQRIDQRRRECDYLVAKFYPLVQHANKKGWPTGTHIKLQGVAANIQTVRKKLRWML